MRSFCSPTPEQFQDLVIWPLGWELWAGSGDNVDTGHWQSVSGTPMDKSIEIADVVIVHHLPQSSDAMQQVYRPNLPWAEDHFQERVSRVPHNPPPSYEWWPFNKRGDEFQKDELFSHTYPERFWPKRAGTPTYSMDEQVGMFKYGDNVGIRYKFGDLDDVVDLLIRHPHTRQAWLPVWFPEDTGAAHGERVPCTLGYHFSLRNGRLDCRYVIRSCDFLRHFRDDIYMAARLAQWVLSECRSRNVNDDDHYYDWDEVKLGTLTMTVFSMHIFEGDLPMMRRLYEQKTPADDGGGENHQHGGIVDPTSTDSTPSGGPVNG